MSEAAASGPSILLVDDNDDARVTVSRILGMAGYQVTEAPNARAAAALLHEKVPDLVITDIFMPDGDGIETLNLVRRRWPAIPVIAISGGSPMLRLDYLQVAADLGANATIQKPFAAEDFLKTVRQVLDSATAVPL